MGLGTKGLISVRAGDAEPERMALPPGEAVGPLSIGTDGTWRIAAAGVLEEHGYVYFNGSELFLQSAEPSLPLLVNGAPIPTDWTAVYAPCEIAFGAARLWFGLGEQHASRPAPPPPPPPPPSAAGLSGSDGPPFARGAFANRDVDEETRIQPVELRATERGSKIGRVEGASRAMPIPAAPGSQPIDAARASVPAPSFGAPPIEAGPASVPAPSFGAPPSFGPPSQPAPPPSFGPPSQPAPAPIMQGAPQPAAQESWAKARWREASGPQKGMVVLLLPLIASVWIIFTDPPPRPAQSKPAASGQASANAAAANPAATGASSAGASTASATLPVEPPSPSGSASALAKTTATSQPSSAPGVKTPQREAADAVAAGAFDQAAKLYEELAKAHPDVPAYAEAARILRARNKR